MTLTITVPVTSTCSPPPLSLDVKTLPLLQLSTTTNLPAAFDTRTQHPYVNARVLQHVATARAVKIIQETSDDESKESAAALVARCAPIAYMLTGTEHIKQDLFMRGPVIATLQVTQHFCDYWSNLIRKGTGGDKPFNSGHCKDKAPASIARLVAVVGWTQDDEWIVALGWGWTSEGLVDYGRNGCCLVKTGMCWLDAGMVGMLHTLPQVPHAEQSMSVYRCVHPFVPVPTRKKPKVQVKAKVVLAHGDKRGQHPKSMMQKVSAGDIASITFMALTIAIVAIFLCFSLTRRKRRGKK